jgi:hypothetical protein
VLDTREPAPAAVLRRPAGQARQSHELDDLELEHPATACSPALIADWNGPPIAGQGVLIRQTMLAAAPP